LGFFRLSPLSSEGFADKLDKLYYNNSHSCGEDPELKLSQDQLEFILDTKVINNALINIYKGLDISNEIEQNLLLATWQSLNLATDEGFGKIIYGETNFEFVQELKYNNAVFAAFKTHRQQNDLAKMLLDEEDKLKSFAKFRKDAGNIIANYNQKWLQTEYNTAVIRARTAAQFKQFEKEKHIYPNLMWVPSTATEPRSSHVPYYNKVWKMDDSFWSTNRPGTEWGCKCGLSSTDKEPDGHTVEAFSRAKIAKGLENNPAKDAKLFSDKHPYVEKGYGSKKKRKQLAVDTADKASMEAWVKDIVNNKNARGITKQIGTINKGVAKALKKEGIIIDTEDIFLSDKAVLHMMRDAKTTSPLISDLATIKQDLNNAEIYFDTSSKHKNLLYVTEKGNDKYVKYAIQPNYKTKIEGKKQKVNYVLTGGCVDSTAMKRKVYKKIKLK